MQAYSKQVATSRWHETRGANHELADTLKKYEVVELTVKEAATLLTQPSLDVVSRIPSTRDHQPRKTHRARAQSYRPQVAHL